MAQVLVELSGDEAKLLASYRKTEEAQRKMDQGLKEMGKSAKKAGEESEQAFGTRATQSLRNYLGSMVSMGGAATVFWQSMQRARQETQQAINEVNGLSEARRRLLQVSQGGSRDVEAQNLKAEGLAVKYGISRTEARNLLFGARSESYVGSEDLIARLARANFASVEASQTAAGTIPTLFPGVTPEQSIAAAALASKQSKLSNEDFLSKIPKLAAGAAVAKATPAETMATLAVLAGKDPEAANILGSFSSRIGIDERLGGRGILAGVEGLAAMPSAERAKFLGTSKELNVSYSWLRENAGAIRQLQGELSSAMADSGVFAAGIEKMAFDPNTYEGRLRSSQVQLQRAQNLTAIERERALAASGFDSESVMAMEQARMQSRGVSPLGRFLGWGAMQQAATTGAPPSVVAGAGRAAQLVGTPVYDLPSAISNLADTIANLDKLGQVADRLDSAAQSLENASGNAERGTAAAGVRGISD